MTTTSLYVMAIIAILRGFGITVMEEEVVRVVSDFALVASWVGAIVGRVRLKDITFWGKRRQQTPAMPL